MADPPQFLKVLKRAEEVRARYAELTNKSNILVYGNYGTGKTRLASTCPRPVWIDSFDPGGSTTRALQPLIDAGDIIVENKWERDSWKKPFAFKDWEREMRLREQEGLFQMLGTYQLDSITRWADSMMYEILRLGGDKRGSRQGGTPELQDYMVQQMTAVDWLGVICGYPCNVLVTGHIGLDKDEVTGKIETGLLLSGKLSHKVPMVFDEKWITRVDGDKYTLQTRGDGYYKAETRMGGELFTTHEPPDVRELLKKAGRPFADRPSFKELADAHKAD